MAKPGVRVVCERNLCVVQRGPYVSAAPQFRMESTEKRRHCVIVHVPQCADHTSRAGSKKCSCDARHTFYMRGFAAYGATGGEDDDRCIGEVKRSNCPRIKIAGDM